MFDLQTLKQQFTTKRDRVIQMQGEYTRLLKDKESIQSQLKDVEVQKTLLNNCISAFHAVSTQVTVKTKTMFEQLITEGLALAFPNSNQRALIEYGKRGNLIEVDFFIEKENKGKWMKIDPFKAYSGGVASIYAFIVRLALLLHDKTSQLKTLILDEQFVHISANYRDNVLALLKGLGIQIIMVTHEDEYTEGVNNTIKLIYKDDQTVIEHD